MTIKQYKTKVSKPTSPIKLPKAELGAGKVSVKPPKKIPRMPTKAKSPKKSKVT